MARPRRCRRIFFQPNADYFKPIGIPLRCLQEIILTLPETEAIRLIDLEDIEQKKVAKQMKISQPTLSRLLSSARKKLAQAIINSQAIKIQGGEFKMARAGRGLGLGRGRGFGAGRMQGNRAGAGPAGNCMCPKCGYTKQHSIGQPCYNMKCPKCKIPLTRG